MPHVVLVGDSIFDNAAYVPVGESLVEQLRRRLGSEWKATLLACDGSLSGDVQRQLGRLPGDATHICVSAGGNDALAVRPFFYNVPISGLAALNSLADIQLQFRRDYARMLMSVAAHRRPTVVCTIYDAIPELEPREKAMLSLFNDVIVTLAVESRLPITDLRHICTDPADYSSISPIEPSERGGAKIVRAICDVLTMHDFTVARTVAYPG